MRIIHCLFYAGCTLGITLAAGALLIALKPVVLAILWPVGAYWNWVSDNFESKGPVVELTMAIAPVCGIVFGIVVFVGCFVGK